MKKLFILLLAVLTLSGISFAGEDKAAADNDVSFNVFYFHSTKRCSTCSKLEQYTAESVKQHFKKELDSGKVVFKAVNTDDKTSNHYITDYSLFTKSVVISRVKDGKEVNWKNLDKIWELVRDKEKYNSYIVDEIKDFMKEK